MMPLPSAPPLDRASLNTESAKASKVGQPDPIRQGVNQIARETSQFANTYWPENSNPGPRENVVHHHYGYGYGYSSPWWFYPQPVYVIGGGRRNGEAGSRALIGLCASICGAIALFAIGSAYGRIQEALKDLEEVGADQGKLKQYSQAATGDQKLIDEAKNTMALKERICQRIKNSALVDLTLRIGFFVGCGLLVAGAFATYPAWCFVAGSTTAAVSGGAMLLKWGFESTDRQNVRDANSIRQSVRLIGTL